ncbi:MAG: hypothetical protein B7Z37_28445 [Verrucomicrobia bacterium 12-59-8]|nr:MAG: hypothetical protein B7Z37_28445 [Verrucomicrobia bacterium 12-59-8]
MTSLAHAQTYQFDGDLTTSGLQNGNGAWSVNAGVSTNLRWYNGTYSAWDNSGAAIAEFGYTSSTSGGTITLDGEIKLAGMIFDPLGTPLGTIAHAFTGGTLNFGSSGLISVANGASGGSTGNQWVTFTSVLKGSDLTIQKSGGSTTAFAAAPSEPPVASISASASPPTSAASAASMCSPTPFSIPPEPAITPPRSPLLAWVPPITGPSAWTPPTPQ